MFAATRGGERGGAIGEMERNAEALRFGRHLVMELSPASSRISPSNRVSGGGEFCSIGDGPSSFSTETQHPRGGGPYGFDELGLSDKLHRMNLRGDGQAQAQNARFRTGSFGSESNDPVRAGFGSGFGGPSLVQTRAPTACNVENCCCSVEGFSWNGYDDYGGSQSLSYSGGDVRRSTNTGAMMANPLGSVVCENQSNVLYCDPRLYGEWVNGVVERPKEQGSYYDQRERGVRKKRVEYGDRRRGVYTNPHNPMDSMLELSVENPGYNHFLMDERTRGVRGRFSCPEDSFIVPGRTIGYVTNERSDRSGVQNKRGEKSLNNDVQLLHGGICENAEDPGDYLPMALQSDVISSLAEAQGFNPIYFMAKDQQGCRYLQKLFVEGTREDVEIIFREIIDHTVEIMMNPFGNYLVQKLLEVCNEEQRMQIVHMVTKNPGELVKISLNMHGTRSVQKLIETVNTRQQISRVIAALEPGILHLIKDLNGNHVLQHCLRYLSSQDNKFIFDSAAKFCVHIATHQHGCCVMQRCIAHATGEDQENLIAQISANGLLLAQDVYGNYVVQYIIELKIPTAAANLLSQFEGNYVYLSMQKFSSHVVEKCLKFIEESRPKIVCELLSVPHFEQLLQDPFANYVVRSALEVTKGALHATLVEAVRPHKILRTSPYCKRIFSPSVLKH